MGEGMPKPSQSTPEEIEKAGEQQTVRQREMGNVRSEQMEIFGMDSRDIERLKKIERIDGFLGGVECQIEGRTIKTWKDEGKYFLEVDGVPVEDQDRSKRMLEKMELYLSIMTNEKNVEHYYGQTADYQISQSWSLKNEVTREKNIIKENAERMKLIDSILG